MCEKRKNACKASSPDCFIIQRQKKNRSMNQEILYRYFKGETTPKEELQIGEWLEADPVANQQELDVVRFIFEGMELYGGEVKAHAPEPRGVLILWKKVRIHAMRAAAVLLLLFTGIYAAHRLTYESISDQITTLHVPNGQRIEIMLPDGSHVWLNSGARIEYPVVFKKNVRRVRLSGEALFDVQHDSKCPFEVETFATRINVLGTKFNVIADESYNRFSTSLLRGKIRVTNLLDPRGQQIVMNPDETVNLSNGRLFVETMKNTEAMCWTEGLVNISGLPFDELMSKFEQVFDVRIVISRTSIPDIGKISGKIRVNDGIENALRILQYAADFSFDKDDETNVVTIR